MHKVDSSSPNHFCIAYLLTHYALTKPAKKVREPHLAEHPGRGKVTLERRKSA